MATARKMLDQPAEDLRHNVEDAIADIVGRSSRATGDLPDAEGSLTNLWLGLTHAQLTHNLKAMQELMACRDWQAAGQVQQTFIQASVARLGEAMSRHLELTGEMTTRLLARDDAAIATAA